MSNIGRQIPSIRILETRLHMVRMPEVVSIMADWITSEPGRLHHVINTGMHGVMEAHKDPGFAGILRSADLLAPDGILALMIARLHGYRIRKQETGPELLWQFSETAHRESYRYFFYGDTEDTLERLSAKISREFPNLQIAGYHAPPFRPLTPEEDEEIVAKINQSKPDVLWVGLGMPRQEQWISDHRDTLNVPVAVGAGASFKFISGTVSRAPAIMRNLGFEWVWRLAQEPRRVWRRVLIDSPQFIILVLLQLTGLRRFE